LHSLAELLRDRGQLAEARALLEEAVGHQRLALKANPRHPDYRKALESHRSALARTAD
jgi:hypothetical protein